MFPPPLTLKKCAISFHEQHHYSWHVPATFDHQEMRYVPTFGSQEVCNSTPWTAPWLTCSRHFQLSGSTTYSRHFRLSGSAYFHFMSCTNAADMFLLSRRCLFPFSWATPSRLTCSRHLWLSAGVYIHLISSTIMAEMFPPLLPLRWCVLPFHELHHHSWHVPATFNSAGAYFCFMSSTIRTDMFLPLSTISLWVFLFISWAEKWWLT